MPGARQVFGLFSVLSVLLLFASVAGHAGQLTADQWREDLGVLDNTVRTVHKSPFHTVSEADYTAMIKALHTGISTMSDQQIIVAMLTSFRGYLGDDLLAESLYFILWPELVLVYIPCTSQGLGSDVSEKFFFGREMAVNTFDAETVPVSTMR